MKLKNFFLSLPWEVAVATFDRPLNYLNSF